MTPFDDLTLSRVEDAGLNASAPPQQRWLDGWLIRFNPGKAKRARCINALAPGRLDLADKLELARAVFREAGLPLVVRITPFTMPPTLDADLATLGLHPFDDTRVMVADVAAAARAASVPEGCKIKPVDAATYAEVVGHFRASPPEQRRAHAERLAGSPVPYSGFVLEQGGKLRACGQFAREGAMVGLYDVFTASDARGQGLAKGLCAHLLGQAAQDGAKVAYLQVDAGNAPARKAYARLGFSDGYTYHYRTIDPDAA